MRPELFFVHGAGCTRDVWREQRASFPNARAVALPGHDAPGTAAEITEFVAFLHAEITRSEQGRPIVVGSSLGGAIAIALALTYPSDVAALVVAGSGAKLRVAPWVIEGLSAAFSPTVAKMVNSMFAQPNAAAEQLIRTQMECVGCEQTLRDFLICDTFDVRDRIGSIAVPFLALTGSWDVFTPPKYGEFLRDAIAGAEFVELPDAGHLAMLEQPATFNAALNNFIARIA